MNKTLDFYDQNAKSFFEDTSSVDFESVQRTFIDYLVPGSTILDFGCGSGRDTAWFLSHGFKVDAIDGSEELCRLASEFTGIPVRQMLFQELDAIDRYDGIWACSSILHVPKSDLPDIFRKMVTALKDNGIIYTSFKYGEEEGIRNGRYFSDFTEDSIKTLFAGIIGIQLERMWISSDQRPGRETEKWLNIILRKQI